MAISPDSGRGADSAVDRRLAGGGDAPDWGVRVVGGGKWVVS